MLYYYKMVKSYLVTIKNNANTYVPILELQRALAEARELYHKGDWHCDVGFELDKLNRMHLHTVVKFPNTISCKTYARRFRPGKSWHINFTPIKKDDVDHVIRYCLKEKSPHICEERSKEHFLMRKLKSINIFKLCK